MVLTATALFMKYEPPTSSSRLYHLVLKGDALGIVFRKPSLRGVSIREDLKVFRVTNLLAGVDVDPDCFHEASRLIRQHVGAEA